MATLTATSPKGTKQYYDTANPYEKRFGYHRAVRKGPFLYVSGTTAIDPTTGKLQHPANAFGQADVSFREGLRGVEALGGSLGDVVRVRMFVANQEDTEAVGRAFSSIFNPASPGVPAEAGAAATMIVVGKSGFVDPNMLVEIELDAVVT